MRSEQASSSKRRKAIFPDTNVFLHFRPLSEIDWPGVCDAEEVILFVPPVILRELNHLKDLHNTPKIRSRAQTALKTLGRALRTPGGKVSENVFIAPLTAEPQIDYLSFALDRQLQDDVLLGSIIEHKALNPGVQSILITSDLGLELKAKSRQIDVMSLPDEAKLPEIEDQNEKRIRELEEEVRRLSDIRPNLLLRFPNGFNYAKFTVKPVVAISPTEMEDRILAIKRQFPVKPVPEKDEDAVGPRIKIKSLDELTKMLAATTSITFPEDRIPEQEFERYNREVAEFYRDYEGYLHALLQHENRERVSIKIELEILNDGTAPAEDIDINIHFPDGFDLADKFPEPPSEPEPPEEPKTRRQILNDNLSRFASFPDYRMLHNISGKTFSNVSAPEIKRSNSYDVDVQVRRLKHLAAEKLDPLWLTFPSFESASSFRIEYTIHVANLPDRTRGALDVVIEEEG